MLNIRDFGAVADGKTVNTKAVQAAVDRAGETGETVLVPGGGADVKLENINTRAWKIIRA